MVLTVPPTFEVDYVGGRIELRSDSVEATVTGIAVRRGFFGSPTIREPFTDRVSSSVTGHIDPDTAPYTFVLD